MAYTGNKVFNIFINSANRSINDKSYDFTVYFESDEIIINPNEGVNINVASFSLLNSMYNVNEFTENNKFKLREIMGHHHIDTVITIPFGNYSVYTYMDQLNIQLSGKIQVSYNVATNTWTTRSVTNLPTTFGTDASLCHTCSTYNAAGDDDFIYLIGNNASIFYRYSIVGDSWVASPTTIASCNSTSGAGCAIIWMPMTRKTNNALQHNLPFLTQDLI
jgi:hypothetical protein